MKLNFIITVILLLFRISFLHSQASEHLKFKNVPIDGKVVDFTNQLKNIGFIHLFGTSGFTQLRGDFAGYKNCSVLIPLLDPSHKTYKVIVFFPDLNVWQELLENYTEIKEVLTEKYGEPAESSEKFEAVGNQVLDNRSPLYKVRTDRCLYYCIWNTSAGDIQLFITHKDGKSCMVKLVYVDKINAGERKNMILGDL